MPRRTASCRRSLLRLAGAAATTSDDLTSDPHRHG